MVNNKISVKVIDGLQGELNKAVQKTGNETINGQKTFNDTIYQNKSSISDGHIELIPHSSDYSWIDFHHRDSTNDRDAGLILYSNSDYLKLDKTPDANVNGNEIVTASWSNTKLNTKANDSNTVHKTNEEEIAGVKNFTDDLIRKNKNIDIAKLPSTESATAYYICDKNQQKIGVIEFVQRTDGNNSIRINVLSQNKQWGTPFEVLHNNDTSWVSIAQPNITANGSEAITANWFNKRLQPVSVLPAEPDENVFYFIEE